MCPMDWHQEEDNINYIYCKSKSSTDTQKQVILNIAQTLKKEHTALSPYTMYAVPKYPLIQIMILPQYIAHIVPLIQLIYTYHNLSTTNQ